MVSALGLGPGPLSSVPGFGKGTVCRKFLGADLCDGRYRGGAVLFGSVDKHAAFNFL
jgi:hypothetical protein